jgi:hypothetical protein
MAGTAEKCQPMVQQVPTLFSMIDPRIPLPQARGNHKTSWRRKGTTHRAGGDNFRKRVVRAPISSRESKIVSGLSAEFGQRNPNSTWAKRAANLILAGKGKTTLRGEGAEGLQRQ